MLASLYCDRGCEVGHAPGAVQKHNGRVGLMERSSAVQRVQE